MKIIGDGEYARLLKTLFENYDMHGYYIGIGARSKAEQYAKREYKWGEPIAYELESIGDDTTLGVGTIIMPRANIMPGSRLGKHCLINTGAIVEHDCVLEDGVHLCPGVILGGGVKIGAWTQIGLGAIIRDHITIGDHCVIGMGSVVLHDIPARSRAWGKPARIQP
jgi:sugar O-acyltransferase (sialic acid O-acetyltransferase NeuD family)